ncbi:MAG: ABC transporter ATP-binding protein [Candidatus Baltobacteraceae bacterium]
MSLVETRDPARAAAALPLGSGLRPSASGAAAVAVTGLTKRYGGFTAVDDISLRVEAGDFFAFLGPNGAGKTTTINAIVGLASLTSGSIQVFGHDIVADWRVARRFIGLAPQEFNFDRYLSIRDILIYQAGYYGLRTKDVRARADALLERFGLSSKAKETYTKLSGGMKRRLSLARALIHDPQLLILDEPTAGVDVELRLELWDLLRELNAAGVTIFLTTHYLEEAESLCRNVGIIESGRLVALEPTKKLLARHGANVLTIKLDRPLAGMPPELTRREARFDETTQTLVLEKLDADEIGPTLEALERAGYRVEGCEFGRASLQTVFLELTRR